MSDSEKSIDRDVIERIKKKVIIKENTNLKTHLLNDTQMIKWIKNKIEEEVECYLNQLN